GLLGVHRALHLAQHAGLRAFDDLEAVETELAGVDHVDDQTVAVIAGLDTVNLAAEFVLELGDVGERFEAGVVGVFGHGQRVFRALEVGYDRLDRAVLSVGRDVGFHGRHPVAEEDVYVLVLERGIGDGYRKDLRFGVIAERIEDDRGGCRGGGDVGPTDVGEGDGFAAFRVGGKSAARAERGRKGQRDRKSTR